MLETPKAALRGEPSYVWRAGQERRLEFLRRYATLDGRRILDIGCGIGTYMRAFRRFSDDVYGVDVDVQRVHEGGRSVPNLMLAVGERLPFADRTFDVVLLNEVIEHVADDALTLAEACRVVRPGGYIFIYAPNRFYPFETHGIYWGKRYIFGNIPLVNYLPNSLRNRLVPHARAYTAGGLRRLVHTLPLAVISHTVVYPGFDGISARRPRIGRVLRALRTVGEGTPLRFLGLSHFLVLRRRAEADQHG